MAEDLAELVVGINELKNNHQELLVAIDLLEKEIRDHDRHNSIIHNQNVRITKEIDSLREAELAFKKRLEHWDNEFSVSICEPVHYAKHSYTRTRISSPRGKLTLKDIVSRNISRKGSRSPRNSKSVLK
jgi:hypothetical protein